MQEPVIERIKSVISLKSKSVRAFALEIDFPYNTLNQYVLGKRSSVSASLIEKIIYRYEDINPSWLLSGKGEMLNKSDNKVQTSGNGSVGIGGGINGGSNVIGGVHGNNVGNTINITLPKDGTQKIIKPDGTFEIYNSGSDLLSELNNIKTDNALLKQQVEHLTEKVEWITKSKDEIIETLRGQLEQFSHSIDK